MFHTMVRFSDLDDGGVVLQSDIGDVSCLTTYTNRYGFDAIAIDALPLLALASL